MSERLTELLPWYVNGTLADGDRRWVDEYLAEHPEARGELEWYVALQRQLRESMPETAPDIGLDRVMRRIEIEKAEIARAAAVRQSEEQNARRREESLRQQARLTVGDRLRNWLASFSLKPVLATALAVVAVQSVMLANYMRDDQRSEIRAIRPVAAEQGPVIKLNFKADATEADIRLLLVEIEGTMAGGPGQLGDWYVRVPAKKVDEAVAKVNASRFVESSAVLDAVPARD